MKKSIHKLTVIACLINVLIHTTGHHAITYKLNPGRLGDHLLTLCKAEIISNEHDIKVLYLPFTYSDMLKLHKKEMLFKPSDRHSFKRTVILTRAFGKKIKMPTLYYCTLKTRLPECDGFGAMYRYVQNHPAFKKRLCKLIAPIKPIKTVDIPDNVISIAVHVRKGGGFDKPLLSKPTARKPFGVFNYSYADKLYPTRFPPEVYYIEQIKKIAYLFAKKQLFVHIFTDDQDPEAIVARFKQQLHNYPITFSCREKNNHHDAHVLDDLFAMTHFNCLIRPASSYSKMAQLLGSHTIIMYPKKAQWLDGKLVVTDVGMINNT